MHIMTFYLFIGVIFFEFSLCKNIYLIQVKCIYLAKLRLCLSDKYLLKIQQICLFITIVKIWYLIKCNVGIVFVLY